MSTKDTTRVIYTTSKGNVYKPATLIDQRTLPGGRKQYRIWWESYEEIKGFNPKWVDAAKCRWDTNPQTKHKKADRENTWWVRFKKLFGWKPKTN